MHLQTRIASTWTLAAFALGSVACGDDTTETPPTNEAETISGIVTSNPSYSLLAKAVLRAGLAETLNGPGPFTVFAPNDAAFQASGIDAAAIDGMSASDLARIIGYHALSAKVPSASVKAGVVTTVSELSLFLTVGAGVDLNGGNATTGGARVQSADIEARNGVIHGIDRVLLPPDVTALARYGGLSTLAGAIGSAGLGGALSGNGPFTVFAPTNEAFGALASVPTGAALAAVLKYHVVGTSVPSSAVPAQAASISMNEYGDPLTLLFDTRSGVKINGGAEVKMADLRATNGVVHVIDRVLLPMNVAEAATAAGLTGLLGAVSGAEDMPSGGSVAAALSAAAPYTVFAPTNAAFEAIASTVAGLSPAQIRSVILYHVLDTTSFETPVLSTDLPAGQTDLLTLNGANATLSVGGADPKIGPAKIVRTDIVVTNGVIHLIDAVLVPPTL